MVRAVDMESAEQSNQAEGVVDEGTGTGTDGSNRVANPA